MRLFPRLGKKQIVGIKEAGIGLVKRQTSFGSVDSEPQNVSLQQRYDNAYLNFPLVAAAIDLTAEQVVQQFHFEGPNANRLMDWADKVNLGQQLYILAKHLLKNGNVWVEFPTLNEMKFVDPKTMVTHRTVTGDVIGHSQEVDFQSKVLWGSTGDEQRDGSFPVRSAFENIVHFKFNTLAGDKYGTSIIHSTLPLLDIKDQMESDMPTIIRRYAAPLIHVQMGDPDHMPSDDDIAETQSKLQDIYADTEYVTNHLTKMTAVGFEGKAMKLEEPMKHIDANIIAGLQVPPELIGLGTSNKAESEVKLRSFGRHVKAIQRAIAIEFEDKVIQGMHNLSPKNKLVWGQAEEREFEIFVDVVRGLVTDGIITPQKGNDLLPPKFHEALPELPPPGSMPIGGPGNPQDQTPFKKGADAIKDNPTDPTKQQRPDTGTRRNKSDRGNNDASNAKSA